MRRVLAAALLLAASPAGSARAATASCRLVVDLRGDVSPVGSDALDVLSADVASDAKRITVTVRLAGPATGTDQTSPGGRAYRIGFRGQGGSTPVYLSYLVAPAGTDAAYGHWDAAGKVDHRDGAASVRIVGSEVRLSTSLASFARYGTFAPGARITGLAATTGRYVGAYRDPETFAGTVEIADSTAPGRTYVAGRRSCLKVF